MKKFILIVVVLSMAIISCQDLNVPDEVTVKQEYFPAPELHSAIYDEPFSRYRVRIYFVPDTLKYLIYIQSEVSMQVREIEVEDNNVTSTEPGYFSWNIAATDVKTGTGLYDIRFQPPYRFGVRAVSYNGVQSAVTWSEFIGP